MLRYTIKAKGYLDRTLERFHNRRESRMTNAGVVIPKFIAEVNLHEAGWSKLDFNDWFTQNVQNKFAVGDLICYLHIPVRPNVIPFYWKIEYINELFNVAKYDCVLKEPNVLHCKGMNDSWIYKCPSAVRKLTKEEMELVNLQNSKPLGHC